MNHQLVSAHNSVVLCINILIVFNLDYTIEDPIVSPYETSFLFPLTLTKCLFSTDFGF